MMEHLIPPEPAPKPPEPKPELPKPCEQIQGMDSVAKQNEIHVGNRECKNCQTVEKAPKPEPPKRKRPEPIPERGAPSKVCVILEHLIPETKEMDAVPKKNDTRVGNQECENCQTIEKAPKPKPPKQKRTQTIPERGAPSKVCVILEHLIQEAKEMDAVPKQNETHVGNRECENSKTKGVGCRSILQSLQTFFMWLRAFQSTAYLRPAKGKKERKVACQSI